MNDLNEILWITQMQPDGNDREIVTLDAVSGTWERLHRIFTPSSLLIYLGGNKVLITLKVTEYDLSDEDPLEIPDFHAQWLLKDFFKLPEKIWKKVKVKE